MARTEYSDNFKAEALAVAQASPSVAAAARKLDMPESTLHNWIKGVGVRGTPQKLVDEKKGSLADAFERIARECIGHMTPEKMRGARLRDLSTTAGIAIDKMRLLREESTSITETRSGDEYRDIIAERLARLRATEPVPERN